MGRNVQLSERDRALLAWCGEQYTVRTDLLAVLMARYSEDPEAQARGRLTHQTVSRRLQAWKHAGLVKSRTSGDPAAGDCRSSSWAVLSTTRVPAQNRQSVASPGVGMAPSCCSRPSAST